MSVDLKKKILITEDLARSDVGAFFQEIGFDLEHSYVEGRIYRFVLDSACPEVKNIPRLQMSEILSPEIFPMICGRVNKEMFESEQGRALLSSYFHDALEFDLVDRYSKEMSNIYSIKIHEYLNLGFFIDLIIIEAYKASFDITSLRMYLNSALSYSFNKVESNSKIMPIDVSYSHNGEAFAVQISLLCEDWRGIPEMEFCIDEFTSLTNFFDVTYFDKMNRLTLSALIFKNPTLKIAKANFFTEIVRRSPEVEIKKILSSNIYSGLIFNERVRYESPNQVATNPATKLFIARKFAHFIKDYRQNIEDPPISLGKLVVDDVINYLAHYPKQGELEEIDFEVKNLIFKLLVNGKFSNEVDDFVTIIMDSSPHGAVREIQKIMGDRGLDEIENIIAGHHEKPRDGFSITLKGDSEKENSSSLQRIKGGSSGPMSDNDLWEIRKAQLNIHDNASSDNTPSTSVLKINENERWKTNDLNDDLAIDAAIEREKLEIEFSQKVLLHENKSEVSKEKLESQMDRIKKIMLQLKKEILKLKAEKDAREELDRSKKLEDDQIAHRLKSTMDLSIETMKSKDQIIEKTKNDFEQLIKIKDQRIETLEQKINLMTSENAESIEALSDIKVKKLENENKTLSFKLELANKKYNIVTEKMGQREVIINKKHNTEIDSLKGNLKMAQTTIEEMKLEFKKNEIFANELLIKNQNESGAIDYVVEKDGIIQGLSDEKKELEEKLRSQSLELKKAEQKLKFTLSQLESSNKRKMAAGPNQKSAEVYAKQLDHASGRLAEAAAEVIEKRREIVKVKQENSMLSAKITELEKKLAYLDKKSA